MREPTVQELQQLPSKPAWSDSEALSLYKIEPDGTETCCGSPTPYYVQATPDRIRWSHCCRIASVVTGEPASGQLAGSTARAMFVDRAAYAA